MVEQRRGRPSQYDSQWSSGYDSGFGAQTGAGTGRGGYQPESRPIEHMEPMPGDRQARAAPRQRAHDAYSDQQYSQQPAPSPAPAADTVTLTREQMSQLSSIAAQVKVQQEENQRKEAELREREETLRKGTALLLEQRDGMARKEEVLKAREVELRTIAGELEKQAKRVAEKEGALAQQRSLFAEEEARRRKLSEGFRAREGAIVQKEGGLRSMEKDLRLREQAVLAMEMDIKECPYCNVRYEFEGIREMMDEARSFGLDLSEQERKFEKAQEHLKRESYSQALESARGLISELKSVRDDILVKGVQYIVSSAGNTVAQAAARGLDVSEAEGHMARARAAMAKKDFRTAEGLAKEAEYIARDLMKQESLAPRPVLPGPDAGGGAPPGAGPAGAPLPQPAAPAARERPWMPAPAAPPPSRPPETPGAGEPDTGPRYISAPPPRYEPVGDSGPQYESVPGPQYEPAPEPGYDESAGYGQQAALPQYQPPVEEPSPPAPKKYTCSSCRAQFTIGTPQRPVKVNCPSCRTMMIIRE